MRRGDLLSDSVTDISSRLLNMTLSVPSPGSLSLGSFPRVPCLPPSLGGKLLCPPTPTVLGRLTCTPGRTQHAVWTLVTSPMSYLKGSAPESSDVTSSSASARWCSVRIAEQMNNPHNLSHWSKGR